MGNPQPLTTPQIPFKMVVKAITSLEEFNKIINGDKVAVIDMWATWCGPCKMISPVFEKLSEGAIAEKVDFYKVDVDEQEEIAKETGVRAMPTFMFFKNGQKVHEVQGAVPQALQAGLTQF